MVTNIQSSNNKQKQKKMKAKNNKTMKANFKKHLALVQKLAKKVNNRATYGMDMYAIDLTQCGICEPFSDPENDTIYRFTLEELAIDTFETGDVDHMHYRDAAYRSIFDY